MRWKKIRKRKNSRKRRWEIANKTLFLLKTNVLKILTEREWPPSLFLSSPYSMKSYSWKWNRHEFSYSLEYVIFWNMLYWSLCAIRRILTKTKMFLWQLDTCMIWYIYWYENFKRYSFLSCIYGVMWLYHTIWCGCIIPYEFLVNVKLS